MVISRFEGWSYKLSFVRRLEITIPVLGSVEIWYLSSRVSC